MEPLVDGMNNGTYIILMLVSLILYHKAKQNRWILWGSAMAVLFTTLSFSLGEMYIDYTSALASLAGPDTALMSVTGFGPVAILAVTALGILAVCKRKGGTPIIRANTSLILIALVAMASGSYWSHAYATKPATMIAVTLQDYLVTALHFAGNAISSITFG